MSAVPPFVTSVNFAKSDLLLISIHLFNLQMLLFHPNLIIVIVFFTAYLILPLTVFKEFKNPLQDSFFLLLKDLTISFPLLSNFILLPVHKRIKFKIATITFTFLKN